VSILITLTCTTNCFTKEIILIAHSNNAEKAKHVKELMYKKFDIPKRFIRILDAKKPCDIRISSIFYFCINENKKLMTLKKSHSFYENNLKIFRKI
jgi:hypothetical protein